MEMEILKSGGRKMKTKTIVILVLIVLALVLVVQNSGMAELRIFFWKIIASRVIFTVGLLAVGFVLGYMVAKLRVKS